MDVDVADDVIAVGSAVVDGDVSRLRTVGVRVAIGRMVDRDQRTFMEVEPTAVIENPELIGVPVGRGGVASEQRTATCLGHVRYGVHPVNDLERHPAAISQPRHFFEVLAGCKWFHTRPGPVEHGMDDMCAVGIGEQRRVAEFFRENPFQARHHTLDRGADFGSELFSVLISHFIR
jgi:hypothetical protein